MRFEYGYAEEEKLGKPYDVGLLKRLYPFTRPYRKLIYLSIFMIVLITMVDLSLPYITKIAIDRYIVPHHDTREITGTRREGFLRFAMGRPAVRRIVSDNPALFSVRGTYADIPLSKLSSLSREEIARLRSGHLSGVTRVGAVFFVLIITGFVLNYLQILVMEYTGQKIMHDLRMTLYEHIQRLSVSFFNRNPVGRLVTRVTNDVQNMNELFTSVIVFVFKDLFLLAGIAAVLMGIDMKLALISFTVLPPVLIASGRFAARARETFRTLRIKLAEINTRFSETIGGIKVIQLFRHEKENLRRFERLSRENYLAGMQQVHIFAVFMPVIELLGATAIAVVIYFGGRGVIGETVTLGALVAFISYMRMFFRPIRDIAEKYNVMQNAMASAERLFVILDAEDADGPAPGTGGDLSVPPAAPAAGGSAPLGKITSVSFEDVYFAYPPEDPVLRGISFTIRAGESLAIVGPTGAGKTTLVNLLTRFYDPLEGTIRINGLDTRLISPEVIRSRMALVPQDPFLFSDTVRNNIFRSAKTASVDDRFIQEVLEATHLTGFVDDLPEGLDTVLSEGGQSISSGQRQLISIARAFARDPELIILDEATSYIDSETEQIVQNTLRRLMRGRASIIIAHRLSTARQADRIMVLNRGRIMESGTHAALMEKQGFYYRLHLLDHP